MKKKIKLPSYDGWRLDLYNSSGVLITRGYCRTYAPLRLFSDHFQDSPVFNAHIRPCSLPIHLCLPSDVSVAWPSPVVYAGYIVA